MKSIRIIVDTILEAAQNGLSQREAKRVQKSAGPIIREQVFEQQEDVEVTLPAGYGEDDAPETTKTPGSCCRSRKLRPSRKLRRKPEAASKTGGCAQSRTLTRKRRRAEARRGGEKAD